MLNVGNFIGNAIYSLSCNMLLYNDLQQFTNMIKLPG